MPIRLRVRAEGFDRVQAVLLGQQRRARSVGRNVSPIMLEYLRETVRQYYLSQGGPGGPWPPLAASTVAKKGHATILLESGRLIASLTGRTADSILDVARLSMRYGTQVPYAKYHEAGEGVPERAFMPEGRAAADFAARRGLENILGLTPGSLGGRR